MGSPASQWESIGDHQPAVAWESTADHQQTQPGFFSSLAERANPLNVAKGVASTVMHPIEALKSWRDQSQALHDAAIDASQRGDYREALDHALGFVANIIPGVGKAADDFLTAARTGTDEEFKSKAGAFLGSALAMKEVQGAGELAGKVPAAASAVAEQVKKPGTLQVLGGGAQLAAGVGALFGHEPMAGVYALGRGVRDVSTGLEKRSAAEAAAPAAEGNTPITAAPATNELWNDIAQGMIGKRYSRLNDAEQAKVRDLAAKMEAPKAAPQASAPGPQLVPKPAEPGSAPPSEPPAPGEASAMPEPVGPAAPQPIRLVPKPIVKPGPGPIALPSREAQPITPEMEASGPAKNVQENQSAYGFKGEKSHLNAILPPEPGYLYHYTTAPLAQIAESGLKPTKSPGLNRSGDASGNFVFGLSHSNDEIFSNAIERDVAGTQPTWNILRFKQGGKWEADPEFKDPSDIGLALRSKTSVPPSDIEVLQNKQWIPVTQTGSKALTPAQELAQSLMGTPEGGTIPSSSPHPPPEAFKKAFQGKRASVLADAMQKHGITYQESGGLKPEMLSDDQWETLLGKDPDTGVQYHKPSQETLDQARVLLSHKWSGARNSQASQAATALADEMNKPEAAAPEASQPKPAPRAKKTNLGDMMK